MAFLFRREEMLPGRKDQYGVVSHEVSISLSLDDTEVPHHGRMHAGIERRMGTWVAHIRNEKFGGVVLVESGLKLRRKGGRVDGIHPNDLLLGSDVNNQPRANLNLPGDALAR